MITLAVADNGFDARPLPEEFVLLGFCVGWIRCFRNIRDENLRLSRCLLSSVSPVASQCNYSRSYDDDDSDDYYSPTSWERDPEETDQDYADRMEEQQDWLESFDD